jgi:cytosine deaminase
MDDRFLRAALDEAISGYQEINAHHQRGIPIGSVLVIDGEIIGRGHNRRVQEDSPILHAEIDCLRNAGRLKPVDYKRSILYTTLSPCPLCSGAVLLYGIPKVVIGENDTFRGAEDHLHEMGVVLDIRGDNACRQILQKFIAEFPEIWFEDIGRPWEGK